MRSLGRDAGAEELSRYRDGVLAGGFVVGGILERGNERAYHERYSANLAFRCKGASRIHSEARNLG